MDFSVEKKGYNRKEVDSYLKQSTETYESALSAQKTRIQELKEQLSELEKQNKTYREKSNLVTKAIYNAVAKADEIEKVAKLKYNQEISQLKAFHLKWTDYFNRILDAYPLDETLGKANNFHGKMSKILSAIDESNSENNLQNSDQDELDIGFIQRFSENQLENSSGFFQEDSDKTNETQIGYIKVKTDVASENDDSFINSIIPGADTSSPIFTGNFNPIDRINRYFAAEKQKSATASEKNSERASAATEAKKATAEKPIKEEKSSADTNKNTAGTNKNTADTNKNTAEKASDKGEKQYSDRGASGFSFEEALNPKEDLAQIMADLGLLLEDE